MDDQDWAIDYDVIVLGTGLKECILSGLVAETSQAEEQKKTVFCFDRNSYYGGESASLNLNQLWKRFRPADDAKNGGPPKAYGRSNDYCVDLCPKFLMACGNLVKVLLTTKVTAYLEFRSVAGSFVYKGGKIHKVPATAKEAMGTSLMGMFQKRHFKNFLGYVNNYSQDDKKTWQGKDCSKVTSRELMKWWKLDNNTILFTGHAICLYQEDSYLDRPALEMIERSKLYAYSVSRYGNSPYIYPRWGLGGLPEGFSRRCAVYGGQFMLNRNEIDNFVEEIKFDENGHVTGVQSQGKVANCKQLIADPSYFIGTDKVKKVGHTARCICFLDHPLKNTNNADSAQIIIPGHHVKRKSDIYISVVSFKHNVAGKGIYIAVASCKVEGPVEQAEKELAPALKLMNKIKEKFFWVNDHYVACNDPSKDGCFITSSYDSSTHFESSTEEVLRLYKAMTGKEVDLSISAEPEDLQP